MNASPDWYRELLSPGIVSPDKPAPGHRIRVTMHDDDEPASGPLSWPPERREMHLNERRKFFLPLESLCRLRFYSLPFLAFFGSLLLRFLVYRYVSWVYIRVKYNTGCVGKRFEAISLYGENISLHIQITLITIIISA